jgi:hypothetical protein
MTNWAADQSWWMFEVNEEPADVTVDKFIVNYCVLKCAVVH